MFVEKRGPLNAQTLADTAMMASRTFLGSALLASVMAGAGCSCHDYTYLYHYRGSLVASSGVPAADRRIRLQVRNARPKFKEPEWVHEWTYTDWIWSSPSGEFDYTIGGAKWGTCCPFPRRPPEAPPITDILFSSDSKPDGWIVLPSPNIRQRCDYSGCWVDLGSVALSD